MKVDASFATVVNDEVPRAIVRPWEQPVEPQVDEGSRQRLQVIGNDPQVEVRVPTRLCALSRRRTGCETPSRGPRGRSASDAGYACRDVGRLRPPPGYGRDGCDSS